MSGDPASRQPTDGAGRSEWQDTVVAALRATPGADFPAATPTWSRIGGGALSSVHEIVVERHRYFVKATRPDHADMLRAEAEGLHTLAAARAVRVPQVLASGVADEVAFLVLEWLDLVEGGRDGALGRALAKLHAVTGERFGWHRDNTIGTTPQSNEASDDWAAFFRDRRLAPQLALAARNGYDGRLARDGARLLDAVPSLLAGHDAAPSLLHGDLWAGNAARLATGEPVVFDPSVYYGDRETDLAMTELFGGFGPDFYAAYVEAAPLPPGYERRRTLYNLYHVLNHLNLFGVSYRHRAEVMIAELLGSR